MKSRVIDDRATKLGEYIVENKATVRRAAKQFGVSKSTVHKDVSQRLKYLDSGLSGTSGEAWPPKRNTRP